MIAEAVVGSVAEAIRSPRRSALFDAVLECDGGTRISLPVHRWMAPAALEERRLLRRARGPVLDVGCGPGRHTAHLRRRRVRALGIDVSPAAVSLARRRGAHAIRRSIFEPLPSERAWQTVLLLDGNIGIGGDPQALLCRVGEVVAPGGAMLVEFGAPGRGWLTRTVRVRSARGTGPEFGWATVGLDAGARMAAASGFTLREAWCDRGRWFAELMCPGRSPPSAGPAS
jgi:SAM-dependent methyltransferase